MTEIYLPLIHHHDPSVQERIKDLRFISPFAGTNIKQMHRVRFYPQVTYKSKTLQNELGYLQITKSWHILIRFAPGDIFQSSK